MILNEGVNDIIVLCMFVCICGCVLGNFTTVYKIYALTVALLLYPALGLALDDTTRM